MLRSLFVATVVSLLGCQPPPPGTGGPPGGCLTCASASAECGRVSDGCGGVLDCGGCGTGETCGAAGPNRCGVGACTAATCATAGKDCGELSDGCGGVLSCGSCSAPQTCGGGGVANQCGGACPASCPGGTTCTAGRCVVSSTGSVNLEPKLSRLIGRLTIDGATPVTRCPLVGYLRFTETTRGDEFEAQVRCATASGPFQFDLELPDGTWEARFNASGEHGGQLFGALEGVRPWHVVGRVTTPAVTGPTFDFQPVDVTGAFTVNGASLPRTSCDTFQLVFRHVADGTMVIRKMACAATGPVPTGWSATLTRGRWEVLTDSRTQQVPLGLRHWSFVDITAPGQQVPINLRVRQVSGSITLNGGPLPSCLSPGHTVAVIELVDAAGVRSYAAQRCPSDRYEVALYDGTYRATVSGVDVREAPVQLKGVLARMPDLVVSGADLTRDFVVQTVPVMATILFDGQKPLTTCTVSQAPAAYRVRLSSPAGNGVQLDTPCATENTFSAWAVPGQYDGTVAALEAGGTIPQAELPISALVPAGGGAVSLDAKAFRVHAKVLLNGNLASCRDLVSLSFTAGNLRTYGGAISCDDSTVWLLAPAGTYRVEAGQSFSFDGDALVAAPAHVHSGERLDLQFELQRRHVNLSLSTRSCAGSRPGFVELHNPVTGERHGVTVTCTSVPYVSLKVSPGTWNVTLTSPERSPNALTWFEGALRARLVTGLVVP